MKELTPTWKFDWYVMSRGKFVMGFDDFVEAKSYAKLNKLKLSGKDCVESDPSDCNNWTVSYPKKGLE